MRRRRLSWITAPSRTFIVDPFDTATSFCRGIVAILNPIPGFLGSTLDEAFALVDIDARRTLNQGVRSAITACEQNLYWKQHLMSFLKFMKTEKKALPDVVVANKTIQKITTKPQPRNLTEDDEQELDIIVGQLQLWRAQFRKGAFAEMEFQLKEILIPFLSQGLRSGSQETRTKAAFSATKAMKALDPKNQDPECKKILNTAQALLDEMDNSSNIQELTTVITTWTNTESCTETLQAQLHRSKGKQVGPQVASHMSDLRDFIFKAISQFDHADIRAKMHTKLGDVLSSIMGFDDVVALDAHNGLDGKLQVANMKKLADLTARLLTTLAALENMEGHSFDAKFTSLCDHNRVCEDLATSFPEAVVASLPFHGVAAVGNMTRIGSEFAPSLKIFMEDVAATCENHVSKQTKKLSDVSGGMVCHLLSLRTAGLGGLGWINGSKFFRRHQIAGERGPHPASTFCGRFPER
jgi:hypothetical protein